AAGALHPEHLTLIAAPMQFVSDANLEGMDATTYQLFRESYVRDPARTKARFHGLIAKGDREMKRVMGLLAHHPNVESVAHWLPWLENLAAYRLDVSALASAPPTLIIHGMNDAIVPLAQSEALAAALPSAQLNAWAEVGHAPHVHDAPRLMAEIAAHQQLHGVV
ncbi:MAG: alpha/beta hydrolase, partial [Rickettsiales bacterium]|nr:alpha/beta hydrolase [Rickettsiales bacterium]